MAQILDVVPFYGKNFKTLPSEFPDYEQSLKPEVYEAPVKASEERKIKTATL